MRKAILLSAVMVAFLVGSTVALAAVITCPSGPGGECRGTRFADQITGTMGVDQIYALGGDDSVQGGGGADFIRGNLGADFLKGGSEGDEMYSGEGDDHWWTVRRRGRLIVRAERIHGVRRTPTLTALP
jgi:Ca2+-binding RTX toxin-like protein